MKRTALILAAHGSRDDPVDNDMVRSYAEQLAKMDDIRSDTVTVAFHQGEPSFAEVLDRLQLSPIANGESATVTVVPLMTSCGYYCDIVLPRELARNACFSRLSLDITAPVGAHPHIVGLIATRARAILRRFKLKPTDTSLILVGHGTSRHPQSFELTDRVARNLADMCICGEVLAAYLDESPSVESTVAVTAGSSVIVVPFLIGGGTHATRDLPRRLGIDTGEDDQAPFAVRTGGKLLVCDAPLGTDPGIVDIVADLATPHAAVVVSEIDR